MSLFCEKNLQKAFLNLIDLKTFFNNTNVEKQTKYK